MFAHDGTRPGAARENDVGDPDAVAQVGERGDLAVLIREREAGDRADYGQRRRAMRAIQFHQRKRIRQAQHDEEQDDADPKRSGQLLRSVSHAG